jgi:hypothetical protein
MWPKGAMGPIVSLYGQVHVNVARAVVRDRLPGWDVDTLHPFHAPAAGSFETYPLVYVATGKPLTSADLDAVEAALPIAVSGPPWPVLKTNPGRCNPISLLPAALGGVVGGLAYDAFGRPIAQRLGIGRRSNPQDEEMRRLERLAAQGDVVAAQRLAAMRKRIEKERWPKLVRGDRLPFHLQQEVLRAYVHRWTFENEHRIAHQREALRARGVEPVPLVSDAEWLTQHAFWVTKAGKLDARRKHAEPGSLARENSRRTRNPMLAAEAWHGKGTPLLISTDAQDRPEFIAQGFAPAKRNPYVTVVGSALPLLGNPPRGRNAPTLADAAEAWARSRGMTPPRRGTPAWRAMFDVWQRHGMPKNPRRARNVPGWALAAGGVAAAAALLPRSAAPARRRNPALKFPSDIFLGTMPLAEAIRRYPQIRADVEAFRRAHGPGVAISDEVVILDDGRGNAVDSGFLWGRSPEVTYDDVPEGSNKQGSPWGHETSKRRPTYLVQSQRTGFHLMGGMRGRDWLRG